MVKAYSFLCTIVFLLTLGVSGALLYEVFSGKTIGDSDDGCVEDAQGNKTCVTQLTTSQKAVITVLVALDIIVQGCMYSLFLPYDYARG